MFELVTTTPVPRIDMCEAKRLGDIAGARHPELSEDARETIGLSDTVDAALTGLTGAKVELRGEASSEELSIGYLVAYLRHHRFSEAELIDVVWEAAAVRDKRAAMDVAASVPRTMRKRPA